MQRAEFAGYKVTREYYINDAGNQVDNLALSIEARYLQALGEEAEMPDDGYYGEDIEGFAQELVEKKATAAGPAEEERFEFFREYGLTGNWTRSAATWSGSVFISTTGTVKRRCIRKAKSRRCSKSCEQRACLRTGRSGLARDDTFGDDKDRVLVKKDGSYTYLTPDIAYHKEKLPAAMNA